MAISRSPLGLRGLKYAAINGKAVKEYTSQPSWAAWIEIISTRCANMAFMSQPSWAAWIEIVYRHAKLFQPVGRSPLGLRGLKYPFQDLPPNP